MAFDAAAGELRFRVVQFPGQAGATKGFRAGGEGGARREALRFCAGFVDTWEDPPLSNDDDYYGYDNYFIEFNYG